jgi:uroporphyrinogen-III decarboxylase
VFSIDSDGNVMPVLDALLACGINRVYPNEPAAGMDIVQIRRQYGPNLILAGGIDKHILRRGHDAIRRELEYKLQPRTRGGGTIFALDHRIPNGTPLDAYRYYVKTAREILNLPPIPKEPQKGSWRRMAH